LCLNVASFVMAAPGIPQAAHVAGSDGHEGPSERALAQLKQFARIAWEECRQPLTDAAGSAQVRWEIHSTWTLLLCIYHAEAEAERCSRSWTRKPWETETQALRQIFLEHRSARVLSAVLRWLRWVHKHTQTQSMDIGASADGVADYGRTLQSLQGGLPTPLRRGIPHLHPDGPLQQRSSFDDSDLEQERRLLRQLWVCLRRGDLKGALNLCSSSGQAWRTAMLQGMMPFADGADEPVGYDAMEEDEDDLEKLKEQHTDWTELGATDSTASSSDVGNPWRKVWKEQCWDTAERNSKAQTDMDSFELAVYAFCAGHHDALMRVCCQSWADQCWGEMHCLKEWYVERLLEDGKEEKHIFLGEGDCGIPDDTETEQDRKERAVKLQGLLHRDKNSDAVEDLVKKEVCSTLGRLEDSDGAKPLHDAALAPFTKLQAIIIRAAWDPELGEEALAMLSEWVTKGFNRGECPHLVKEFASYFAIWQTDLLEVAGTLSNSGSSHLDAIVRVYVEELISAASESWVSQCIDGHAVELIASHVGSLGVESRLDSFVRLLLRLGHHHDDSGQAMEQRQLLLRKSFLIFWSHHPDEALALITVLVKRTLAMPETSDGSTILKAGELYLAMECVVEFWVALRDQVTDQSSIDAAIDGFEKLGLGQPCAAHESHDHFARAALETVIVPLLTDTLMGLISLPSGDDFLQPCVGALPLLQQSNLMNDIDSTGIPGSETLDELVWYLSLCEQYHGWDIERRKFDVALRTPTLPPTFAGVATAVEERLLSARQRRDTAHDKLIGHASRRLAQDRALLEPRQGMHSLLIDHWRPLQKVVASHVLSLLVTVFEETRNFEGAMYDLVVAVAQSPWMLELASSSDVRRFLQRLSRIPTLMLNTPPVGDGPSGSLLQLTG